MVFIRQSVVILSITLWWTEAIVPYNLQRGQSEGFIPRALKFWCIALTLTENIMTTSSFTIHFGSTLFHKYNSANIVHKISVIWSSNSLGDYIITITSGGQWNLMEMWAQKSAFNIQRVKVSVDGKEATGIRGHCFQTNKGCNKKCLYYIVSILTILLGSFNVHI